MKKNRRVFPKIVLCVLVIAACFLFARIFLVNLRTKSSMKDNMSFAAAKSDIPVKIGDSPVSEYTVSYGFGNRGNAFLLRDRIEKVSGEKPKVSPIKGADKYINVSIKKDCNEIRIENGNVNIFGDSVSECERMVNVFANTYLGYAFAGENREHILENTEYINIPDNVFYNPNSPWMEEREPIVCLWKTDNARGIYSDRNVCLESELMSYSDDELYNYVKLMKYCGYTGVQVTDMCSAWAQYGGYEFVHDRMRFMADAAHSLDMKFTLWVWGAEFEGYGWVDDSVEFYRSPEECARDNPNARAMFEKYYTIYAKLADCSDRVIMHFNDPGKLVTSEDIGYYANVLRTKCIEANPDINFGISCYTYQIEIEKASQFIDGDYTVYSGIVHTDDDRQNVENFRRYAFNENKELGVWSWNLAEMEIDQLAEMNVNTDLISECYLMTKEYDEINKPEYWSEMDSYHIANFFSLYASGHLLQDPYMNPDDLLREAAEAVVGGEYADELYEALDVIQDARTGSGWKEFKNNYDEYILLSDFYPAEDINKRAKESIANVEAMIAADLDDNTAPIPMTVSEMLSMILPHLVQIEEYSEFRMNLAAAEKMYADGSSEKELQQFIDEMYEPVHEYNTVVGSWGQPEARAQYEMLEEFCRKTGITTPENSVFDYYRKQRIYGEMVDKQKTENERVSFNIRNSFQLGAAFGEEETERLNWEMIEDGLLGVNPDGSVYLVDWENYRYDF